MSWRASRPLATGACVSVLSTGLITLSHGEGIGYKPNSPVRQYYLRRATETPGNGFVVRGFARRSGFYSASVPANNDLPTGHELLAYGAAVKWARKTGNIEGPVAHSCAAE